ncbi:MAG: ribosomal L7Ae/L30e/S12e/Gadd45 family protein [Lachnospiraceae bacterium]|nr:ribosomal L7Ae/L30e/S12e/Gadd45 family protein [Lachnospiraceae bacterium]
MNSKKALAMLGMATRAGKTVSGEFAVEQSVKQGTARLVLLAEDASDNTKKKFSNMCSYRTLPCLFLGDKETLGKAIGKEFRACVAVEDENLSKVIMGHISSN